MSTPPAAGDTQVRKVLAMTMVLAAITYLDRVAIGVARPYIAHDLDLTPTQMGRVFSAFYLSYALFEIPTGWWGDKVGTRARFRGGSRAAIRGTVHGFGLIVDRRSSNVDGRWTMDDGR